MNKQNRKKMMEFEDKKLGYSAIVYVLEQDNSVVVHFDGFDDVYECQDFSHYIMKELKIQNLFRPADTTLH
jgi:hypothetical protein